MKGFLFAVLASVLFGVGGTFAQFLFEHRGVNVEWLVTMRLLFAGTALLAIAAVSKGRAVLAPWRGDAMPLILFGLLGMLAVQYTYFTAIHASNTATATVLQFTAPAMIALWLAMTSRRLPPPHALVAVALAMLGTWLMVTHGRDGALTLSPAALFWGLASAVASAIASLQPVALLRKYGASVVGGWGMLVGGVALSFRHAPWSVAGLWDGRAVLFTAFILLFGTLAAFYLFVRALALIGAQKTSLLSCAEPLSAAALAVWWLGTGWGAMDWLGGGLILATIVLLARDQPPQMEKIT
jgi:drug/metabolite transporter (DMT)-like permease